VSEPLFLAEEKGKGKKGTFFLSGEGEELPTQVG